MALTKMKKAFARALLTGLNNRDAALKAGYSAKTAPQTGSRLAKDPDVVAFLEKMEKVASANSDDIEIEITDPWEVLQRQLNSMDEDVAYRAAATMLPYTRAKVVSLGKREQEIIDAEVIAQEQTQEPLPLEMSEEYQMYAT